jgi:serine/threonine protein kinase
MELLEEMAAIQRLATAPTGEDLLDWYAKTGGLRRRLRLLARAADAFASLHAKGIVYADPSPANIMVSDSVRHEEVRLVDVDLLHAESVPLEIGGTPGYAAPELRSGWTGVTNASDAYAFAVIAFETLTQAHPFLGDQVQFGEPEMLNVAYDAKLPWIDHSEDDSNRTRYGLARDRVLSPKLRSLAKQTFQDSLTSPRRRPTVAEWRTALHSAADMTLDCAGCPQSNDARLGACPWCGTPAPDPLVAVVQLALPDRAEPVPAKEGLAVPPASWLPINPRTAYLDAAEYDTAPVAWLWWEDGRVLAVNNAGQIPLWLRPDRDPGNVVVVEPTDQLNLPADESTPRWTIHFGPPGEVHRLLRFFRVRREETGK